MTKPTYSADEIRWLCLKMDMEYEAFKILVDLIEEELDLYGEEDLVILTEASMIMFSRSMLKISLKNISQ